MKRLLIFTLLVCLFAVQANADFYLDAPTARTFTLQAILNDTGGSNTLDLIKDNPGGTLDPTYLDTGYFASSDYVANMQLAVGFAGHINDPDPGDTVMLIGTFDNDGGLIADGDTLIIQIANDNDDLYRYTAWYSTALNPAIVVQGTPIVLAPGTQGVVSVDINSSFSTLGVTAYGFSVDYVGSSSSDDFHTSVVVAFSLER